MVAAGTLISSFWILASNSWMHTPQGHEIIRTTRSCKTLRRA
jgi:cytochrome d ubiquinol oxidase subunit I